MQLQKSHCIAVFVYSISSGLTLSVCFADSHPPFDTNVPPPPAGGVFPEVGAKGDYSTLVTS